MSFAAVLVSTILAWTSSGAFQEEESRALYLQARQELIEERFDRALELFESVVSRFPASEEADDAQFYVGYVHERAGRMDEAIEAFTTLLEEWPYSTRVESARSHRAELAARQARDAEGSAILEDVFAGSGSWELKRDTAMALARQGNLSAAEVLEEMMDRESSSRQIELVRILAPHASNRDARHVLLAALHEGRSTSVQLRALEALEPVVSEDDVARAIGDLLSRRASSSVSLRALRVLSSRLDDPAVRRAASRALDSQESSSVQMLACSVLADHLLAPEIRPAVLSLFQEPAPSSAQRKCLQGIERHKEDLAAADILSAALRSPSASTSVKLQAVGIAASSRTPAVRATAEAALSSELSTSVQLRAVRALSGGSNDESAAEALDALFRQSGVSTSVLLAGLEALASHLETTAGPRALARTLSPDRSTSVQLAAIDLAEAHLASPELRRAVRDALRSDNATSVLLRAIRALGTRVEDPEVRGSLSLTLDDAYSTSVVLASIAVLEPFVATDASVKEAFVRSMENQGLSLAARVQAGARLLEVDPSLASRVADAMEEVVSEARRHGHRGRSDAVDEALRILESIDPARAERLRRRPEATAFEARFVSA